MADGIKVQAQNLHQLKSPLSDPNLLKVHIFWEGHNFFAKSPPFFDGYYYPSKKGGDFAKFLWSSQNIWTLLVLTSTSFDATKREISSNFLVSFSEYMYFITSKLYRKIVPAQQCEERVIFMYYILHEKMNDLFQYKFLRLLLMSKLICLGKMDR